MELEKQVLYFYTSPNVITRQLCIDEHILMHCDLHLGHGDKVSFRVLCAVRLRSCWWLCCTLLVTVNMTWALFCCIMWKHSKELLKLPPLFGRLIRCFAQVTHLRDYGIYKIQATQRLLNMSLLGSW